MAASRTRRSMAKPGPSKSVIDAPIRAPIRPEALGDRPPATEPAMTEQAGHQSAAIDAPGGFLNGVNSPPARSVGQAGVLVDAQVRTLAELCEALDRKCLDLLEDLAAARDIHAATERELTDLREAREQELADTRDMHERELAEARRTQAMLERELAAVRAELERAGRPRLGRSDRSGGQRSNGEAHAARLLRLLEVSLSAGTVLAMLDTSEALARFGAAGMVDAVEGTRAAPSCHGWLLSRIDLEAEPLMFLLDEAGVLGWTDANRERLDVNEAFPDTKPRPGFMVPLSRVPVGLLRGIVAMDQAASSGPAFFEAAALAIPEGLFPDPGS